MRTYATGTALALALPGGIASGTASVTNDTPGASADGTASVDRRAARAFLSRVRLLRPDVYVDDFDAPLAELVEGVEVTERLDDLVVVASFTVAKAEASPFHADPLLTGNRPCRILVRVGPPGGAGDVNYSSRASIPPTGLEAPRFDDAALHATIIGPGGLTLYPLFDGYTDGLTDGAPLRARAQVQALSTSSLWADVAGCVTAAGFAGYTRAQIVGLLAASSGVEVTGLESLASAKVYKPVDEQSISVLGLIRRYGEIEGWRARLSKDGAGIEVLSEDTLLDGSPAFEFDEGNTFNVSVSTPSRPVTDWILSGTRIVRAVPEVPPEDEGPRTVQSVSEGLDDQGRPIRVIETVESWGGAERRRTTETYRTFAPDGDPPLEAAFQLTDRTIIVTEWADFVWYDNPITLAGPHTRPSAQMSSRVVTIETLTSTRAAEEFATTYVWGGDRWLTPFAELTLVERTTETFTWNTQECRLEASLTVVERPFAQRVDPAEVPPGYTYADGSIRNSDFYILQEVERFAVTWTEYAEAGFAPKTVMQEQHSCWIERESGTTPDVMTDVYQLADLGTITWQGNLSDSSFQKTTTVVSLGAMNTTEIETLDGRVPGAPRGSSEQPAFAQEVILKIVRASAASGYIKREESPSAIDFAESVEELETWARRRLRRDHARTVTVRHRLLPYLRVGDHVTVTCTPKGLSAVSGYVTETRRTVDALNGAGSQTTVVAVPPEWV